MTLVDGFTFLIKGRQTSTSLTITRHIIFTTITVNSTVLLFCSTSCSYFKTQQHKLIINFFLFKAGILSFTKVLQSQ